MTEPNNNIPILKPEIISPPSVSNLSVAQVGTGMFSVAMQVIMVVLCWLLDSPVSSLEL